MGKTDLSQTRKRILAIIEAKWFQYGIVLLIVVNAAILGLETYGDKVESLGIDFAAVNAAIIAIFIVELCMRIYAEGPSFFRNGWNVFDFLVVVAALLPAGSASSALRLFRLLRVFRLLSTVKMMRLVIGALGASMPGIFIIGALFFMVLYVFAIASTTLLGRLDPDNFGNLGLTFVSLYRLVMGDGWPDIVAPLASHGGWIWGYFIFFTLVGSVILLNLFVAVVVEAMDRVKQYDNGKDRMTADSEVLRELRQLREDIAQMREYSESIRSRSHAAESDTCGAITFPDGGDARLEWGPNPAR